MYHVLKINFEKLKKCTKKNQFICLNVFWVGFENLGDTTKFAIHCLRVLTNPNVTGAEQSLKVINEEINSFSNFEEQIF